MTDSDETLVAGLKAGSIDAFRLLYDRHRDGLLRLARRILGNDADAEDAVHDAFMTLYEKVGGFRGRSSFATWYYRILINTCLQIRKVRGRTNQLEEASVLTDSTAGPESNEAATAMNREIDALPVRQRVVFHLAAVEGRSHKEVAHILGLRDGTVRHHYFKARERLKERLHPYVNYTESGAQRRSKGSTSHES